MAAIPSLSQPTRLQQLQWIFDPVRYLQTSQRLFPDLCKANSLNFGPPGTDMVLVNHPQALQQLLSDRKHFTAPGEMNWILVPLLGTHSLIMLSGDSHRQRRQLMMPSFHGDRLRHYGSLIQELTHQALVGYTPGTRLLGREVSQQISLQVIFRTVFGLSEGPQYERLKYLLGAIADLFNSPLTTFFLFFPHLQKDLGAWSPWGRFLRLQREADELLYQEIRDRRANPDPNRPDILTLLMNAQDEQGESLSDQELRDELMTLLFAGHETTATAIAWALYWLHRQPEVKTRLCEELSDLGTHPDPLELLRLPYLNAVCNETLRIHPVGMLTFPRQAQSDFTLMDYPIKAGTILLGCIYQTHQRPDLYPNPQAFNPDRFLNRQYTPYEFLPFGGGLRRCMGEALAQFEMKIVLGTVIQHYVLTLADQQPEKPKRRGVTLAPHRGVPLIYQGRRTEAIQTTQPQSSQGIPSLR